MTDPFRPRASCRRLAFTQGELLVVLAILAFLTAAMVPSLVRLREKQNRLRCADNLRQIGLAIQMYANENKGNYPRTYFDHAADPVVISDNRGYDQPESFAPDGPGPVGVNNVCASLFLLLKTQDMSPGVFICPSSRGAPDDFGGRSARERSNFSAIPRNLTYSYCVPFPSLNARNSYKCGPYAGPPVLVIAADINCGSVGGSGSRADQVTRVAPGDPPAVLLRANSNNHRRDGQNVLYADGHVEWQNTPWCGVQRVGGFRDNIYTNGAKPATDARDDRSLQDERDSYLLPVDDNGGQP